MSSELSDTSVLITVDCEDDGKLSSAAPVPTTSSGVKRKQQHEEKEQHAQEEPPQKLQKTDEQAPSTSSSSSSDSSDDEAPLAADRMSSSSHAEPSGDCTFCCDDFTKENYVEYQAVENGPWLKSIYCQTCLEEHFIGGQWQKYLDNIAKADCAAALRRVLSAPPQINVKDAGLPCPDNGNNEEVFQFWYASDDAVHSARLKGSLVGAERDAFWAEKQAFLTATEKQEELTKAEAKAAKDAEEK